MACCTSLPYFGTIERRMHKFSAEISNDELLMYDSEAEDENIRRKCWTLTEAYPRSPLSSSDDERTCPTGCGLSGTSCALCGDSPLLNDCMWSAGMLPPDLMAGPLTAPAAGKDAVTGGGETDAVCTAAVDPSLISPCPHPVTSAPVTSAGARNDTCDCTPPDSDDDDDTPAAAAAGHSSDSSDEVDVVSVNPSHSACSRLSQNRQTSSVVRDLLVQPPACSILAHVTAMHNYSGGQQTSSSRRINSAPQSPSLPSASGLPRHRLGRSVSTPASPCPAARRRRVHRRRPTAVVDESSGSDDSDDGMSTPSMPHIGSGKRAHHNVLERRRRDHLKWSFEALRAVVPGSAGDVRIPKVAILRRARDHVCQLTQTSQRLYAEYSRLRSLHQRWRYKLAVLGNDQLLQAPDTDCDVQPAA